MHACVRLYMHFALTKVLCVLPCMRVCPVADVHVRALSFPSVGARASTHTVAVLARMHGTLVMAY